MRGLGGGSTGLFVYHSHSAGPVLQEFGLVLRVGVRHTTSVLRPLPPFDFKSFIPTGVTTILVRMVAMLDQFEANRS